MTIRANNTSDIFILVSNLGRVYQKHASFDGRKRESSSLFRASAVIRRRLDMTARNAMAADNEAPPRIFLQILEFVAVTSNYLPP